MHDFDADRRLELLAGFIITGILGGMTMLSLFSLLSLNLEHGGDHLAMLINAFGSVTLGWIATYCGRLCGRRLILQYASANLS